jgi:hypothetical protein
MTEQLSPAEINEPVKSLGMKHRSLDFEKALFGIALLLALSVRMLNLGATPLTDREAGWALQALQVARPGQFEGTLTLGPQPAYVFLTGATFALFGATDFWARFWPALAGVLLFALPLFFRRELGRGAALIMAFGLALDPGLVTVSRQAGGPMLALSCSLLALGLWHTRKPAWAGILGGVALLSGPSLAAGALGLGLAWAVASAWQRRLEKRFAEVYAPPQPKTTSIPATRADLWTALLSGGAILLVIGTGLLRYPQGLAAAFGALPAYLNGWGVPTGVSPWSSLLALQVYQPFAVIFALAGLVRWILRWYQEMEFRPYPFLLPLLWTLISLALALLYPGRQVSDLVWTLVPLWTLAAVGLASYLPEKKPHVISLVQTAVVLILAGLAWNTLITTDQLAVSPGVTLVWVRLAILAGVAALGALTTALVALGWNWPVSRDGLVWGLSAAFIIYLTSAMWGAAYLRPNQPEELWSLPPAPGQARLLQASLSQLSTWDSGFNDTAEVISTVDVPSVRWLLRDFPKAHFIASLSPGERPALIITLQAAETPELAAAYRGQDFTWWVSPGWDTPLPTDFITWLTFRQAPLVNEHIILWARADLFPGSAAQPTSQKP